jgi:hypothetical protein
MDETGQDTDLDAGPDAGEDTGDEGGFSLVHVPIKRKGSRKR